MAEVFFVPNFSIFFKAYLDFEVREKIQECWEEVFSVLIFWQHAKNKPLR